MDSLLATLRPHAPQPSRTPCADIHCRRTDEYMPGKPGPEILQRAEDHKNDSQPRTNASRAGHPTPTRVPTSAGSEPA
jgi:hypothetical protein